jgi:PAN domain
MRRQASAAAEAEAKLQTALQAARGEQQQQARAVADADTKRKAAETEQQGLKEEAQRQAKAAADADAKLKLALTEQQRLAKAATDADAKRVDAEKEQQRLAKAVTDADAKRVDAEKEQQRLAEELRKARAELATRQVALPQATSTVMTASFESRPNMEAVDRMPAGSDRGSTFEACQARCTRSGTCQAFTFSKTSGLCLFYDLLPGFRSNPNFDSGVRQSAAPSQATQTVTATRPFSIKANIEASGIPVAPVWAPGGSTAECEQRCAQIETCVAFAFRRSGRQCYFYSGSVSFKPNQEFDSGERSSASSGR